MDFKIDGKPMKLAVAFNKDRVRKYLDSLPDGELVSSKVIQEKFSYTQPDHVRDRIKNELPEYTTLGKKNIRYFGSKKTIKAFLKQVNNG